MGSDTLKSVGGRCLRNKTPARFPLKVAKRENVQLPDNCWDFLILQLLI